MHQLREHSEHAVLGGVGMIANIYVTIEELLQAAFLWLIKCTRYQVGRVQWFKLARIYLLNEPDAETRVPAIEHQ